MGDIKMSIDITQIKGLREELNNKVNNSNMESLINRVTELENKLNLLTDSGKITTISLVEEES